MQAMILAAGFGTRLLPHTHIRPKPLFPLLNRPLLLLMIERLQKNGFDHILVNCHHLRDQIVSALDGIVGVTVIEEEHILGTGGGLRGAFEHMRKEPLLVTNGDIYHTVDVMALYDSHCRGDAPITMAIHNYPRFNNVQVEGDKVTGFGGVCDDNSFAYTGLQVIDPEILEDIEKGSFSCIIEHYKKLLGDGGCISSFRVDGCYWTDMGTVQDYLGLHEGLLTGQVPPWEELAAVNNPFCVSTGAMLGERTKIDHWACIGDARLPLVECVMRSVIWDGVSVSGSGSIIDSVVSTDII